MSKKTKLWLSVLFILLTVIFLAGIIIPDLFQERLREALIAEFYEQSDEQYSLDLAKLNISLWSREISADSIVIKPSSNSLEIKKLEASSITIDGIQWRTLISQRFPEFGSVTVTDPVAELYSRRISSARPKQTSSSPPALDIRLSVFDVFIKNGKGKIVERDGKLVFSLGSFDLSARQVNLNTILQGAYVPYLQDLSISGSKLFWNLEEEFYHFTIEEFAFNKNSKKARVEGLAFTPIVPKYEFSKFKGKQIDRFDLSVKSVEMMDINLDSLFIPSINLSDIIIKGADLEVFHDKHMPPGPAIMYKPLLHKVSQEMGFSFGVKNIEVRDSQIRYGEHHPGSEVPGFVSFNNLNATLTDYYTKEHPNYRQDSLRLKATTDFMDNSLLTVNMSYAVFSDHDDHTLEATLSEIDGSVLNEMLVPTAFIRVDKGFVHSLYVNMKLTDLKATGSMKLVYENLKITVLDKNDATNTNFKTRLKSLIANNFVMKTNNIGPDLEIGEINFERPKDKAIFGYWWKSIQSGLEDSIK